MGTYDTRGGSPISPDENEPDDLECAFDTAARAEVTVRFAAKELSTADGFFVPCKSGATLDIANAFIALMEIVEDEHQRNRSKPG